MLYEVITIDTVLAASKQLRQCAGTLLLGIDPVPIAGYEIHVGVSTPLAEMMPLYRLQGSDGPAYADVV